MITTIIFDLGGVYLKSFIGAEYHLEPILGIKAEEIYSKLLGKELDSLVRGKLTEEEYWLKIIEKNNWKVDIESLKKAIRDYFEEIKGTREIIERLKERSFKLGLLSVHVKEWIDYFDKKFDYHKLFHYTLYSFEVGLRKPEKRMYELILLKLDSKPEECIFIDDNSKYLVPAKELGMKTIHFKGPGQLENELRKMGIL